MKFISIKCLTAKRMSFLGAFTFCLASFGTSWANSTRDLDGHNKGVASCTVQHQASNDCSSPITSRGLDTCRDATTLLEKTSIISTSPDPGAQGVCLGAAGAITAVRTFTINCNTACVAAGHPSGTCVTEAFNCSGQMFPNVGKCVCAPQNTPTPPIPG